MTTRPITPLSRSGFCMWPDVSGRGHGFCKTAGCECTCHAKGDTEGGAT